jgi:hypothetical protein
MPFSVGAHWAPRRLRAPGCATVDSAAGTDNPRAVSTVARIPTFAFAGIEAVPVEVQVQIASGLPGFVVVGLPD